MDFITGHGKLFAWIAGFIFVFLIAFTLYVICLSPFMLICSIKFDAIVAGGIGCGIGTALVNAFVFMADA